jgi:hypothetical protein
MSFYATDTLHTEGNNLKLKILSFCMWLTLVYLSFWDMESLFICRLSAGSFHRITMQNVLVGYAYEILIYNFFFSTYRLLFTVFQFHRIKSIITTLVHSVNSLNRCQSVLYCVVEMPIIPIISKR